MSEQTAGWVAWRAHWGAWDILDEQNRVIGAFDDCGGEIRDMEERAFLAAAAPMLRDALLNCLDHIETLGHPDDEVQNAVIAEARAALKAAAPPAPAAAPTTMPSMGEGAG